MPVFEIRLRPTGPWRAGQSSGDRMRVDSVYHSDALYSAVTHAMSTLGWLDEWLNATARALTPPAVTFSSLFPFTGKTRLAPPPRSIWPPATAGKLYLKGVRFVPFEVAIGGIGDEAKWFVDGASESLLPVGASAPFEISTRSAAAVDRITGQTEPHRTACLEFAPDAGWWGLVAISEEDFADAIWEPRVRSALRWLADSGFGGERSLGWGRAAEPEILDAAEIYPGGGTEPRVWWMLSLYSPHDEDAVDWSRGEYSMTTRGGWVDSPAGSARKRLVRLVEEGSVLVAQNAGGLRGRAVDVAPEGFAHPVWRAGFAFAFPAPAGHSGESADLVRNQS